ncbi:tyrosine-type recombinase/integrase [Geodermatophilus sp. SYSU D01045]
MLQAYRRRARGTGAPELAGAPPPGLLQQPRTGQQRRSPDGRESPPTQRENGEPCDPRDALRALEVAATRAGIPHAGLHALRHSAASVMPSHGVPLEVVSEILGHASIAITGDVHGHVAPDVSREAMDVLSAAFGG